jgi:SAM-dependent methyltransferase
VSIFNDKDIPSLYRFLKYFQFKNSIYLISIDMQIQDYLNLYRLAKRRLDSAEAYQAFQQHQGELLVRFIQAHHLVIEGKKVLDLGCGLGGYSLALQEHGAQVISVDLSPIKPPGNFKMFCGDAMALPLDANCVDWVICASLIEHVFPPENLLKEIQRVLREDGFAYLSFPPFYTPIGGHHFSPYHLLGERFAIRMQRRKGNIRSKAWLQDYFPEIPASFSEAWGDWGLYPLTITGVEKLLHEIPFQILERSTRWLPLDFSGIPLLREFLTWHVQFLLSKKASSPEQITETHASF